MQHFSELSMNLTDRHGGISDLSMKSGFSRLKSLVTVSVRLQPEYQYFYSLNSSNTWYELHKIQNEDNYFHL